MKCHHRAFIFLGGKILNKFLSYPSAAITGLLSPTHPCSSDGGTSSSSDDPALDDSSSLSASIHSFILELKKHNSSSHHINLLRLKTHFFANTEMLNWVSPHFLGLWYTVSLILSLFTQLTQVHLGLQGHLKAAGVHQLQL